ARVMFQKQAVHACLVVKFPHQATEGHQRAHVRQGTQGTPFGLETEVLLLYGNADDAVHVFQPPVTGGKKATSSPSCTGVCRLPTSWLTATSTRSSCSTRCQVWPWRATRAATTSLTLAIEASAWRDSRSQARRSRMLAK